MTRSRDNSGLVVKLQERGYSREQVTTLLDITDTMVSVALQSTNLVKRFLGR